MINNNSTKVQKSLDTAQQTNKNGSETEVETNNNTKKESEASPEIDPKILEREFEKYLSKNETAKDLKESLKKELKNYMRIGDDYYQILWIPDKNGTPVKTPVKRKKGTIIDDFGKYALQHIKKYKSFCLVPSHLDYKQEINGYYNRYVELDHEIKQGKCPNSLKMVKHIFGEERYELGLDYLKILFEKPNQLLPILALVSEERNTGKSTFGQWLIEIFQQNTAKLGNADLSDSFNDSFAEKLLIVVDETSIEKRVVSEAVKRMATEQGKILVNSKNIAKYEVDWIGKFIFISNNETDFIHIGKGENRYLVLKIPTLKDDNPNFKSLLIHEIPHFLHFLHKRDLKYPQKTRTWFDYDLLKTEALQKAIEANLHPVEKAIKTYFRESFERFTEQVELRFSLKDLFEALQKNSKYVTYESITKFITKDLEHLFEKQKSNRYKFYSLDRANYSEDYHPEPRNNVHYIAKVQNFLSIEEMGERANFLSLKADTKENLIPSTNHQHGYPKEWDE